MAFQGSLREFLNPNASRSGLDRCLCRHGVSNLRDLKENAPNRLLKKSSFLGNEYGIVAQMAVQIDCQSTVVVQFSLA